MDYQRPPQTPRSIFSSRFLMIAAIIFAFGALMNFIYETNVKITPQTSIVNDMTPSSTAQPTEPTQTQKITIVPGDTLATILNRANLPSSLWLKMLQIPELEQYLDHLQVGNVIIVTTTPQHQFVSLQYPIDLVNFLEVFQHGDDFSTRFVKRTVTQKAKLETATAKKNVAQTVKATGLSKPLQRQLTAMLSSGLAQIHPGDRINILYHEYLVGDQKVKHSDIVAAEINTGDKNYRIVQFKAPEQKASYYTADGKSAQSPFLKTPVNYKRVASRFTYSRLDPYKHYVHAHLGVDLAAPRGTPVKAIGDGVIVFCKRFGGYGNAVMIRYNKTYKALYGHLERFSKGLHAHQTVKKGQVIGYVGSTGWATGPHLHFSLYKNGKPVDPLKVQFPHTTPIAYKYRKQFFAQENQWFHEMDLLEASTNKNKELQLAQKSITPS